MIAFTVRRVDHLQLHGGLRRQIVKLGGSRSGHEQYTALEGWIDSELSANANVVVAQYR